MSNTSENKSILKKDGVSYLVPFILITFCFALWGFANDITNPMVKAFSKIFRMSVTTGPWFKWLFMADILPWPFRQPCLSVNILIKPES